MCIVVIASVYGQQQQGTVEKRLDDLEKRISTLEKASPLSALINRPSPTPPLQTNSPLELVSWEAHLQRGQYSDYHYRITLTVKNNSEKEIKLIDATVQFSDLLGAQIYGIKVTPDRHIQAGKTVTDTGEYRVNQFVPEQARLAQMKKEDVKATLVVSKLVFADNTVGEYSP